MSFDAFSRPSPTVNTGMASALSDRSAGATDPSVVSAPSVTITRPASGSPASSSFARSSASPTRVCVPPNVRFAAPWTRSTEDENRKNRSTNFPASACTILLSLPKSWRTSSARGWPPSAICMLRESSSSTRHEVLLRDAPRSTSTGRKQTESDQRDRGNSQRDEHCLIAFGLRLYPAVGEERGDSNRRGDENARRQRPRRAEREVAL